MKRQFVMGVAAVALTLATGVTPGMASGYTHTQAACMATQIYKKMLLRAPDPGGLYTATDYLVQGHSMLKLATNTALSPEFYNRFLAGKTPTAMAKIMYERLLGREPENGFVVKQHATQIFSYGWQAGIGGFTGSPEFKDYWVFRVGVDLCD